MFGEQPNIIKRSRNGGTPSNARSVPNSHNANNLRLTVGKKKTHFTIETICASVVYQDPKLKHQLTSLTLRGSSGMRANLHAKSKGVIILCRRPDAKIVGWGFAYVWGEINVYVNRKYRRLGVGAKIAHRAKAVLKNSKTTKNTYQGPHAYPWDKAGRALFSKVGIESKT